jgi:hypothetical protein
MTSSIASYPFSSDVKRSDSDNASILLRLANKVRMRNGIDSTAVQVPGTESELTDLTSGLHNDYSPTNPDYPNTGQQVNDYNDHEVPIPAFGGGVAIDGYRTKMGPTIETISGNEVKSLLFKGGLGGLVRTGDQEVLPGSLVSQSALNWTYKYYFGFDSGDAISHNTSFSYGVRNTNPINSSAVYRHQQFGQFRDMLEQRQFGRFYKKAGARGDQSRFKFGMQPHNTYISAGPLTVKFVESNTETRADPTATITSSNMDNHATSSMPFIDDDVTRNRTYE